MEFLYIAAEICQNLDWFVGRPFETVIHCRTKIKKNSHLPTLFLAAMFPETTTIF